MQDFYRNIKEYGFKDENIMQVTNLGKVATRKIIAKLRNNIVENAKNF